jgi:hypothetical protein
VNFTPNEAFWEVMKPSEETAVVAGEVDDDVVGVGLLVEL